MFSSAQNVCSTLQSQEERLQSSNRMVPIVISWAGTLELEELQQTYNTLVSQVPSILEDHIQQHAYHLYHVPLLRDFSPISRLNPNPGRELGLMPILHLGCSLLRHRLAPGH
ncbi:hypothetical protein BDZ97DRAFT_1166367 [Flammula alnicola]|nr:hypothetical protein BDZ97DRAFT_1166367 [Flammula alnicola]